jgi:hypothetical protein
LAFLPVKSASTTPRAVAQALQTKIGIWCSITLAIAWLSGGQPTGVTFAATNVRINTVASPASSMRTSWPASRSPTPQANGKLARVGFSEPQSPTNRKRCFGSSAAAAAVEANSAVHKCCAASRRVGMTGLYHSLPARARVPPHPPQRRRRPIRTATPPLDSPLPPAWPERN